MPSNFIQGFLCFAYISLCKTYDLRADPFLNQATFNKLGRGLLDDYTCTYYISRLCACSGSDKRQYKDCNPLGQAFLVIGQ